MWWARAALLHGGSHAGVPTAAARAAAPSAGQLDAPAAYRQMVRSFWTQLYGAREGPRGFPGKLLAHSASWVQWRKESDEEMAMAAGYSAWDVALLGQTQPPTHAPNTTPMVTVMPNTTLKGWCLKADPCPLHAFTHPPPGRIPSLMHILNCTLPEPPPPVLQPETRWLKGSFHLKGSYQPARFAMLSEHLTNPAAHRGVCAFASGWLRSARERACALSADSVALECAGELETTLAVTQLLQGEAAATIEGARSQAHLHSAGCVLVSA